MRVLLEVSAEQRPGADRGIGRYLHAVRSANDGLGHEVGELAVPTGESRASEMVSLVHRTTKLRSLDFDLFHAPTAYYATLDLRCRPMVASILDVIPLDHRAHRQTGVKARLFHHLASRADSILTLSGHAAGRIVEILGVDPERIVVAPLPPGKAFVVDATLGPDPGVVPPRYVAMLSDLRTPDPRKRVHWLPILAKELWAHGIGVVVAGGGTEQLSDPGIYGLGWVDDTTWATVLRNAAAFVYTSEYEGQGLPPLEAISCGTPVIGMSNTAIPEVVGPAGYLVEDLGGDEAAPMLASETLRIIHDGPLLEMLTNSCREQAARFTPERFAAGVATAYGLAIERRS